MNDLPVIAAQAFMRSSAAIARAMERMRRKLEGASSLGVRGFAEP